LKRAATHRPSLEVLEDRRVPAFLAAVNYAVGLPTIALGVGDFNGDAILDLATANARRTAQEAYTVSVLLGNADGTFQPPRTSVNGAAASSLKVGDFNGDGFDDLATADLDNVDGYDVNVLLSNGDGTFRAPINIDLGPVSYTSVAVGDFNRDGKLDLAVTGEIGYYYGYQGQVNVLLGNGDGSFSGPITSVIDETPDTDSYAVVADFNGDGKTDMMVNGFGSVLMLGDGQGHLSSQGRSATLGAAAVGDVNGDGKLDLVRGGSVLLGDGAGGFPTLRTYDTGGVYGPIVVDDFNGDNRLDIAMRPWEGNYVRIFRGRGDGTFGDAENFAAGQGEPRLVAGDFNGDGWLDVATTDAVGESISVLINNRSWPTPPPAVSVSDATVTEGNTGTVNATFTVTLSAPSAQTVTVQYATANGTATAGSDYQARSGTLSIPAGQTRGTITVLVIGDRLPEPNETFFVNLSGATNATIADGQGIGTILDNEPGISISDVTRLEGKRNKTTLFTFTVTLSVPYDQPVTVSFRTANGTATTGDGDYVARTGTLTFAPSQTTKTITIEVKGDSKRESNETFYLDLFGNSNNSWFSKSRGIGTILNDD
jgi:hypothetical protein